MFTLCSTTSSLRCNYVILFYLILIPKRQQKACIPFHLQLLNYRTLFRTHLDPLLSRNLNERQDNVTLFQQHCNLHLVLLCIELITFIITLLLLLLCFLCLFAVCLSVCLSVSQSVYMYVEPSLGEYILIKYKNSVGCTMGVILLLL